MKRRGSPRIDGWRRHFDGWQVALVLVICALVPAMLTVPHATVSRELPMPAIDRSEERRKLEIERQVAEQATHDAMPYSVRAVGEAIRRHGAAHAHQGERAAQWSLEDVHAAVKAARTEQQEQALLKLRAVQTQLFLRSAATYDPKQPPSTELLELGGEFFTQAKEGGWLSEEGILGTESELHAWFLIRWGSLTQLSLPPFAPSLNDWRSYYGFLLHPGHQPPDAAWQDVLSFRGRVLDALGQKDPDYPLILAKGILKCQQGDYAGCSHALQGHLARVPDGPWALRARSTLKAATTALGTNRR